MKYNRLLFALVALASLALALPGFAAGTPGDPVLLPDYFQNTQYYDPPVSVSGLMWSTTLDLAATGDDAGDRAYVPGTPLQSAYVTLEHYGSPGASEAELWLLSVSGELLVGVLGNSNDGWRREHFALTPGARASIQDAPTVFKVRLVNPLADGAGGLDVGMVRVSGSYNCAPPESTTPEPTTLALLLGGTAVLVPAVALKRRAKSA